MNTSIPSVEEVEALDGKIFEMLNERELYVYKFYRDQGRKYGVAISIKSEADPAELKLANSQEQAEEIMRPANSTINVTLE